MRDSIAAINVGPDGTKYYVYKSLVADHSAYFKKALNGAWKGADEGVICLDDVNNNTCAPASRSCRQGFG
jgi:hypothetical protein